MKHSKKLEENQILQVICFCIYSKNEKKCHFCLHLATVTFLLRTYNASVICQESVTVNTVSINYLIKKVMASETGGHNPSPRDSF